MKLFVTGASSFVGAHFCRLAASEHEVTGLWRSTPLRLDRVRAVQGEVAHARPPPGTDVVLHLAAKVMADDARAQNRAMMSAVLGWGLPVVYASSTVVHWPCESEYRSSRIDDEARLVASGLPWLTIRPCAPYGPAIPGHQPAHRESFHQLASWVARLPIVPMVGDGRYRRQPVHVDDFNGAILGLLRVGRWNGAFDSGGPDALTMRQVIAQMAAAAHRRVGVVGIPLGAVVGVARFWPGMRPDVVRTFTMDDAADPTTLANASGIFPRDFLSGSTCLFS